MSSVSSKRTAIVLPSVRPAANRTPRLVVIAGPEIGRRIDIEQEAIELGRADDVTLRIESDAVSRKHACVRRIGDRVVVVDLESTNGTYVNDRRIRSRELREGDQIRVGKVVLKYTECAIEAEYHDRIFNRASVDGLTGAFNKRYFSDAFERCATHAQGEGHTLSLVIFDVDHFKCINDTHGHPAGDAVLRKVGELVPGQLLASDIFCRVGGEEFALLLPYRSLVVARGVAESLRSAIELTEFSVEALRIPVTVSLGVGQLESGEMTSAFYQRVDARLYEAKQQGRNRVC